MNLLLKIKDFFDICADFTISLIKFLQKYLKHDVILFFDKVADDTTELIDAYSLFEKSQNLGLNSFYIMSKSHESYKIIKSKYHNKIIEYDKFFCYKHFILLAKTYKFFTAFALPDEIQDFIYSSKYIDLIFLGHGLTLLKDSISQTYNSLHLNKFLVSNDYEAQIVKKLGGFSENDLIKATMPRFDLLKNTAQQEKNIFFFFTWRMSFGTCDYKKSLYYKNLISLLTNPELNEFAKEHNIILNAALHHCLIEKDDKFKLSDNINLISSTQISSMIKSADMLITDYSSVWGDFFFCNKPVIFYRLDINDNNLISRDIKNFEFAKQSDSLLSNIVTDEKQVTKLIKQYSANNFQINAEEKNMQDKFFYCKKDIREAILKQTGVL